ncbi:hypothetical protein AB4090_11140 [Acidithiobacillus sp. IBUN Pt1247-S3]|uniref:hypothetical protein n=1 Tax=Acidithiobacillus sp. IBUN Pt1247-S3 TaxID=3166642 RepID=UPI0034E42AC7
MNAVPAHYQGVWKRALLTAPGLHDDTTLVFWMQTTRWHADLRIPANRPDCTSCTRLADCSRTQLLGLLQQEGFAGITTVHAETCEWQREFDYHPRGRLDRGRMLFSQCTEAVDEYGIDADYAERWERDPASERKGQVAHIADSTGTVRWLRSGKRFMRVRPRAHGLKQTGDLWSRHHARKASIDDLRQLADFEISYGLIAGPQGCILHSTLPWLEWQHVDLPTQWSDD